MSTVVVTREPEWDDAQRDALLGYKLYESQICECGFHKSLTRDKSQHFDIEDDVCFVCRAAAQYSRVQSIGDRAAEKALGENAPPMAVRPSDGRRTHIRHKSPLEIEALRPPD
ncbi:hypothetical protein [Nocardioides ochotonae]|uniref:hypothetical protein n=1 Tax=Nocardioides ochotonae TaxID=2685869 RepID=UPI0014072D1F|nr:hypothetical protein [Nocardioides ochotonae]